MVNKVTYTEEMLDDIKARLVNQTPVEIANELGINSKSLIAKLSSMGLYKKKPYLTKTGEPSVKKSELVDKISELCGESSETFESLEKCNKRVLELLIKHLTT